MSVPISIHQRESKDFLQAQIVHGRSALLASAFVSVGGTLCVLFQTFAFARSVSLIVIEHGALRDCVSWFFVCTSAIAAKSICTYLSQRLSAEGALKIQQHIRATLLSSLFSSERIAAELLEPQTAETAHVLIEQVDKLENYYTRYLPRLILAVVSPLILLLVIFPTNWVVGLMLLLATPIIPFYMALIGMGAETISRKQIAVVRELSAYFLDRLQGLQTLKSLGAAERELSHIAEASHELGKRTMAVLRVALLSSAVLEFFSTFAMALVATYIGLCLLKYLNFGVGPTGMSLQKGLFLLLLAAAYFQPLRAFAAAYHDRADAIAAAEHLVPLVFPSDERHQDEDEIELNRRMSPIEQGMHAVETLELRNVTVHFAGRTSPAISNISLTLKRGQKVAVTGPSGSGKSSLLGMIVGHVPVTKGEILFNGSNLSRMTLDDMRARTSWIGQRPYLFPGTLADNIAFGQPERSRKQIEEAACKARVLTFASNLPDGLETVIGERGLGLSGGEAQRVALARAFLKDAPLLVLDEPTAHLDEATEAEVIETIAALAEGRMILIATHSQALIELCDRVIVLHEGVLMNEGVSESEVMHA